MTSKIASTRLRPEPWPYQTVLSPWLIWLISQQNTPMIFYIPITRGYIQGKIPFT